MSDQRTYKGKFQKVVFTEDTTEQFAENYVKRIKGEDYQLPSWVDSWLECLTNKYDEFFVINGELYKMLEKEDLEYPDFCVINKNDNDTYSFITSFYDGGTYLEEMLEDEFKRINI